jgi:Protein of unknown function (DUF2695)
MGADVMFARMEPDSDDELISSIASDVMTCLTQRSYFEKLDELLSPEDNSTPTEKCDGSFRLSKTILLASGFEQDALDDIISVLQSKGGFCDCEVLYNVAETSRLKANYWRSHATGGTTTTQHAPHSRPN